MEDIIAQRICIKFCVKNKINATETFKMLQKSYDDSALSKTTTFEWHSRFKSGRESVKDDPHPGRKLKSKTNENLKRIKLMVMENQRLTIREIVDETGISFGSIQSILSDDLDLKRLSAKMIPKSLVFLQKKDRVSVVKEMLSQVDSDSTFIERIITGDETWVYEFDKLTKEENEWCVASNEPVSKKLRKIQPRQKYLLTVFFDYRGIVHHEFLPHDKTPDTSYYLSVMERLNEAVNVKRNDLWKNKSWILHHDNKPYHNSIIVRDFLTTNSINVIYQPPYSPDISPCDYFLFSRLKKLLRSTRYDFTRSIKEKTKKELLAIPKSEFEKCFQEWLKRWKNCVASNGEYFDGEKQNIDE